MLFLVAILYLKINAFTQGSPNCFSTVTYMYSVKDVVEQQTTGTSVTFHLEGNEQFDFKLMASNVLGMSTEVTYSNISEQLGKIKCYKILDIS